MPAYLLTHNPSKFLGNPAESAADTFAGEKVIGSWSVRSPFGIKPGSRLFLYRSEQEPRGIFAVGTALPADIPEARAWVKTVPTPVKAGLAAYAGEHWKQGKKGMALYVNVGWEMMVDPAKFPLLIPFKLLRSRKPFTRVFTKNVRGQMVGHAPMSSGTPIDNDVADALYAECIQVFRVVLHEYGVALNTAGSEDLPSTSVRKKSLRQKQAIKSFRFAVISPEERAKIERAAVDAVTAHYCMLGCKVQSVEDDNVGWDLNVSKGGEIYRQVEVKGTKNPDIRVELSSNEYDKSGNKLYRLAIVCNALDSNPVCAIYARNGNEWRRVSGKESGGDKNSPTCLVAEEKVSAIIRPLR